MIRVVLEILRAGGEVLSPFLPLLLSFLLLVSRFLVSGNGRVCFKHQSMHGLSLESALYLESGHCRDQYSSHDEQHLGTQPQ